jgi:hypothetical protein
MSFAVKAPRYQRIANCRAHGGEALTMPSTTADSTSVSGTVVAAEENGASVELPYDSDAVTDAMSPPVAAQRSSHRSAGRKRGSIDPVPARVIARISAIVSSRGRGGATRPSRGSKTVGRSRVGAGGPRITYGLGGDFSRFKRLDCLDLQGLLARVCAEIFRTRARRVCSTSA